MAFLPSEIKKMIFASLLSLAIVGVTNHFIDWGSEKCPWETKRVKIIVMIVIALISLYVLFGHFRVEMTRKNQKYLLRESMASKLSPSS